MQVWRRGVTRVQQSPCHPHPHGVAVRPAHQLHPLVLGAVQLGPGHWAGVEAAADGQSDQGRVEAGPGHGTDQHASLVMF